jgi:hypothetical protein
VLYIFLILNKEKFINFKIEKNITGSTAQGGGGNFKNRKSIGKVNCYKSRMAERSH